MSVLTKPTIVTGQTLTIAPPQDERSTDSLELGAERPSERSGLVFQVLLGAAACLALAGVVQGAATESSTDGPPSDPPPSVFVQTD